MKGFLETMSCLTIPECSEDQVGMLATYGFVDFPGVSTLLRGQEWATENLQIHAWSTGPTCCKTLCSGIAERLRPGCVDLRQVGQLRKRLSKKHLYGTAVRQGFGWNALPGSGPGALKIPRALQ